jgi:hypothetical protein
MLRSSYTLSIRCSRASIIEFDMPSTCVANRVQVSTLVESAKSLVLVGTGCGLEDSRNEDSLYDSDCLSSSLGPSPRFARFAAPMLVVMLTLFRGLRSSVGCSSCWLRVS